MVLRVLHVSQPTTAGLARYVGDLVAEQVGRGWAVHVACPPAGPLSERVARAGAVHLPWQAGRSPDHRVLGEALELSRVVARAAPDLVHLHSAKAGLTGRLALRGTSPTVYAPHAWSFLAGSGPVRVAALQWERRATRWADRVLCVSDDERELGVSKGVRAKYAVVRNGVDLDAFPLALPPERTDARRELQLPRGPLALCLGRLAVGQKGQDLLLDAWPEVRASVPDATLVLVGDGPDAAALQARAGAGVLLRPTTGDAGRWLAAADVVVLPSRYEGMAQVPLEAMARGRSVVAHDVQGVRETLGPSGGGLAAGAVVPVGDRRALAAALICRLRDRAVADAEGRQGRARVEAELSLQRCHDGVASVYASVLAERAAVNARV